jgi:hypothetical protein
MNRMHHDSWLRAATFAALATFSLPALAHEPAPAPPQADQRFRGPARIEVAFVLDTTGSMAGLIDGAKRKIWSIANQLVSAKQDTEVRFALIGYRDRGDEYVTRLHDLDGDIDAVYARLMQFRADGGGDGPESVNQALHEAVTRLDWSDSRDVYKVIFLVGDAPPHLDYQDDVRYDRSVRLARQHDIAVNTVQCGGWAETAQIWREIASLGSGDYAAIAQDGGMLALETPHDEELARLNRELASTVLAYGRSEERSEAAAKVANAMSAPASAAADRLAYLAKSGDGAVVTGAKDVVAEAAAGKELSEFAAEELPETLRALPEPARQEYVDAQVKKRKQLQAEIAAVSAERDAYVKREDTRLRAEGKADAFDQKIYDAIKAQAAAKGIQYE